MYAIRSYYVGQQFFQVFFHRVNSSLVRPRQAGGDGCDASAYCKPLRKREETPWMRREKCLPPVDNSVRNRQAVWAEPGSV